MDFKWGFSFLAGTLTTLSPCVLPILPLVLGSALKRHRFAPIAIAFGLSITFVAVGWTAAAFSSVLGVDASTIRKSAGAVLLLAGIISLIPKAQDAISTLLAPVSNTANDGIRKLDTDTRADRSDLLGSFFTGLLLGVIWSPCSGPTLGAAVALAASSGGGLQSGILMFTFAVGASLPLVIIAYGARSLIQKNKAVMMRSAGVLKKTFAVIMILLGTGILFGLDKSIESYIVNHMGDAWLELTTKY